MELLGRAELEAPLIRSVGLSVRTFYDAGGIFDGRGFGHVGSSVGFGLTWRSPIGPLTFDWAYPLDGSPPRFLFNIGGAF
jgi:outer membrane protein assembly factor BamA